MDLNSREILEAAERLLRRRRIAPSGCWEFTGHLEPNGYGRISFKGELQYAHRLAAQIIHAAGRALATEDIVCHVCDNPRCFNPDHLVIADNQSNSDDKHAKGRAPDLSGERNGRARLTHDQVRELRERMAAGAAVSQLSSEYGIPASTLRKIRSGATWSHARGEEVCA